MNVQLREFENAIDACESLEELWEQLCEECRAFGFAAAKLNLAGQIFEERFASVSPGCWRVVIPMGERVMLYLTVPPAAADKTSMMMSLVGRISKKMPKRTRVLEYEPTAMAAFSGR